MRYGTTDERPDAEEECDCERFGFMVPGRLLGSSWPWVPCPEHYREPPPAEGEIRIGLVPR